MLILAIFNIKKLIIEFKDTGNLSFCRHTGKTIFQTFEDAHFKPKNYKYFWIYQNDVTFSTYCDIRIIDVVSINLDLQKKVGDLSMELIFSSLHLVDKVLLIVLIVCLGLKLIKEVFSFYLRNHKRFYGKENREKCFYLKKAETYTCYHPWQSRNFNKNGNMCLWDKCKGYFPSELMEKSRHAVENSLVLSVIFAVIDWIVNLTTIMLLVRTILEVNVK